MPSQDPRRRLLERSRTSWRKDRTRPLRGFGRPPHGPGNRLSIRERVQSRNRRDRARRVDRRMTCAWGILLTDVRPTHPFMAAPARARQTRKSVVEGKRVSVRVDRGGRRIIKKKKTK